MTLCFDDIRFESIVNSEDNDIEYDVGELTIPQSGADMSRAVPPAGIYQEIEFDLDASCDSGNSIAVSNSNGTFSTSQAITLRFTGIFYVGDSRDFLNLQIQALATALETVNSNSSIAGKAANATGVFDQQSQ